MTKKTDIDPRRKRRTPDGLEELPAPHSAVTADSPQGHRKGSSGMEADSVPRPRRMIDDACPDRPRIPSGRPWTVSPRKDQTRKATSLIDKVYYWDNLYWAWRRVRRNKGAHGLDRMTIQMFESNWEVHLREIQRALMERRYEPQPVRRVYIPKSSNPRERRPLGIPVVKDRIVQQAIFQIVDAMFDHEMSERSFGFRKGRNAHDAIATVLRDAGEGYRYVVDADIASFFDRIDHEVVMSRVRARMADGRVLDLIEAFLCAGVSESGTISVPSVGTPQGGVISPWLANLVLDDLDKAIESKGWRHARYADDFVILCKSAEEARDALAFVKEVLGELKLSLHETKTRLVNFKDGFEFLGFRFHGYHVSVSDRAVEKFKDKVRRATRRQQGRNVDAVLADLNPVLRGWANYFGAAEVAHVFRHLDQWVRMRVRSFRLKRKCRHHNWKLPQKRLAKWGLLSLQECRPRLRLSYVPGSATTRAVAGPLQ